VNVGDLVVVPAEPSLGVGRVERFVDADEVRIMLYARVGFVVRKRDEVKLCAPMTGVVAGDRSAEK
jgi:hypothetical protein